MNKNTTISFVVTLTVVMPIVGFALFGSNLVTPVVAGGEPISIPISSPGSSPSPSSSPTQGNGFTSNFGGTSAANPQECTSTRPVGSADLFQINRNGKEATLYFTPVAGASSYHVVYGYKEGEERFAGLSMVPGTNDGVQTITVGSLATYKSYSFKIIPVNGCQAGDASNWLTSAGKKLKFMSFRYLGR